jgi:hypothetical protein
VRLQDFQFPSNSPEAVLQNAATFNSYIKKVTPENFIKIGVVGQSSLKELPAIVDSIDVSDSLLVDRVKLKDKGGNINIIAGWADADITIHLILIDVPTWDGTTPYVTPATTRYDCLANILYYFKLANKSDKSKPSIFTIQHPHLAAWGIQEVLFNKYSTSENRERRIITCNLEFDEFDSITGKSQGRQLLIKASQVPAAKSVTPTPSAKQKAAVKSMSKKYGGR